MAKTMKYSIDDKVCILFDRQPKEGVVLGVFKGTEAEGLMYNIQVGNTQVGVSQSDVYSDRAEFMREMEARQRKAEEQIKAQEKEQKKTAKSKPQTKKTNGKKTKK